MIAWGQPIRKVLPTGYPDMISPPKDWDMGPQRLLQNITDYFAYVQNCKDSRGNGWIFIKKKEVD